METSLLKDVKARLGSNYCQLNVYTWSTLFQTHRFCLPSIYLFVDLSLGKTNKFTKVSIFLQLLTTFYIIIVCYVSVYYNIKHIFLDNVAQ